MEKEIKKISFNLLQYNQFSNEPVEVDEITFWKYYLSLLQVKAGNFLTDKEVEVVAYILAGVPNKSYLKAPTSKELMKDLKLSVNYLHQIKYSLQKKGILVTTDVKADYLLSPPLIEYQKKIKKYFNNNTEIEYNFKFKKKENYEKEISP